MDKIIERARKGDPEAFCSLYNANKHAALGLARLLLQEETAARNAVGKSFRALWESILSGDIQTEAAFHPQLIRKLATHCRAYLLKQDPKALRVPAGRNFTFVPNPDKLNVAADAAEIAVSNLPAFHRFISVLHGMYGYSVQQLASLLHTNNATIQLALDAQPANFSRILAIASGKTGTNLDLTQQEIFQYLLDKPAMLAFPEAVNTAVLLGIDSICEPIRRQAKARRNRWVHLAVILLAACALAAAMVLFITRNASDITDTAGSTGTTGASEPAESEPSESEPTESEPTTAPLPDTNYTPEALEEDTVYYAEIVVENYGTITVQLYQNDAPVTAANFVKLAKEGFYDGLTFHRIVDGWLIQGGDPNADGSGGSENTIVGEFADNGCENTLSHTAGAISMARVDDYNSAISQFYIVQEDNTEWDGHYAVFGYVTSGMDVVNAICAAAEPTDSFGTIPAENQPVITSVTIREEVVATE